MTTPYRIYCVTEQLWKKLYADSAPTTCPTDVGHTVNSSSVSDLSDYTYDQVDPAKQFNFNTSLLTTSVPRTLLIPDITCRIVCLNTVDILTNKSIKSDTSTFVDPTDVTKQIGFQSSGATTNCKTTLVSVATANRILTLPNSTTTLVGLDTVQADANKLWIFRDEKTTGTAGGTLTSGAWQQRVLNTTHYSGGAEITLAGTGGANTFDCTSGKYRAQCAMPIFNVDIAQARLYNVTDSSVVSYGAAVSVNIGEGDTLFVDCIFTIASTKTFRLECQGRTTRATDGMGIAAGFGSTEIYSIVTLSKIG